jgi:hypothetical protein
VFTGKALVQAKTAPKAKASVAVTASADARKVRNLSTWSRLRCGY